jgi:hypothetical protein
VHSLGDVRAALARGALAAAIAGCSVEDISLQAPPSPPPKGSYGACGATTTALARLPGVLPWLKIDEFDLYALSAQGADAAGAQTIWKVPKDGSPPVALATSATPITGIAFSSPDLETTTGVIFSTAGEADADGGATGAILSAGLDGTGAPRVLAAGREMPTAVVAVGTQAYWAEQGVDDLGNPVEVIMTMPTAGGPVTWLQKVGRDETPTAMGAIFSFEEDVDGSFGPSGALLWTTWDPRLGNEASAEIVICPFPTPFGPLDRLGGPDAGGAGAIALDPFGQLDFSAGDVIAAVWQASDGGWATRPIATTPGFVGAMRDDGHDVYFVDPGTTTLVAVPRILQDAQAPQVVAHGLEPSTPFVVDAVCAYWVDTGMGIAMAAEQ